jgi:hypothetical protein
MGFCGNCAVLYGESDDAVLAQIGVFRSLSKRYETDFSRSVAGRWKAYIN